MDPKNLNEAAGLYRQYLNCTETLNRLEEYKKIGECKIDLHLSVCHRETPLSNTLAPPVFITDYLKNNTLYYEIIETYFKKELSNIKESLHKLGVEVE